MQFYNCNKFLNFKTQLNVFFSVSIANLVDLFLINIITRINVSLSVSAEAAVEAQCQVFLQVFLQHLFFFQSVTFNCPRSSLHCGGYRIPMSYKSLPESSCSNVQLIRTVHSAVLRHMFLGILVQPCSHVGSKPWHQLSSGPYLFSFHRNVQDSAHCIKKI